MMGADPAFALRAEPAARLGASRINPGAVPSVSPMDMLVDDVTGICQRVRYVEVAPARLFDTSLLSELADASDRLAAKVADLQGRAGANR